MEDRTPEELLQQLGNKLKSDAKLLDRAAHLLDTPPNHGTAGSLRWLAAENRDLACMIAMRSEEEGAMQQQSTPEKAADEEVEPLQEVADEVADGVPARPTQGHLAAINKLERKYKEDHD